MNVNFFILFALSPPPPPVFLDDPVVNFASTSEVFAFTGIHRDSVVAMESMAGLAARPKISRRARIAINSSSSFSGAGQLDRAAPVLSEDCAFVFPFNRWNWPGAIPDVTAGAEIGPYVASNTQLQQRSKVLRMSSESGHPANHVVAQLHANLHAPYRINSVCIVSHNLSSSATFRVRIGNYNIGINKYDSGYLPAWEPSFTHGGPYEEETETDGTPSDELIAMLKYCGENPRTVRWIVFNEVSARHIYIDFDDPNCTDGYIEVAYVYVGLCIRTHPDQVYGWAISPVSYSRVRRSASGSLWTDVFYRQVVASATFASQPDPVTLGFWSLISQFLGKKKEFIVAFQPSDSPAKKFWYTIYGRFRQPPQLTNVSTGATNVEMEIEELPG